MKHHRWSGLRSPTITPRKPTSPDIHPDYLLEPLSGDEEEDPANTGIIFNDLNLIDITGDITEPLQEEVDEDFEEWQKEVKKLAEDHAKLKQQLRAKEQAKKAKAASEKAKSARNKAIQEKILKYHQENIKLLAKLDAIRADTPEEDVKVEDTHPPKDPPSSSSSSDSSSSSSSSDSEPEDKKH